MVLEEVKNVCHSSKELVSNCYMAQNRFDCDERLIRMSREILDVHTGMDMAMIDTLPVEHRIRDIWDVLDTYSEAQSTELILDIASLGCS